MQLTDSFLEKWHQCKVVRYPLMLLSPSRPDLFSEADISEMTTVIDAHLHDYARRYLRQLDSFFTRRQIQQEIFAAAADAPLLITGLEPFYSKWVIEERYAFLRYMLRMEPAHGVVLILYCQEDLTVMKLIAENNRGMIWTP